MGDQLSPGAAGGTDPGSPSAGASPEPEAEPGPPGPSRRLRDAIATLWATMADDYGLLPDLAADALLARADRGELAEATPRLVELLVGEALSVEDSAGVVQRLGDHAWAAAGQREAVTAALDAWWLQTLKRPASEHGPDFPAGVVLGVLVGFGAPMVRWLGPWLDELDGPGATHLATVVIGGPDGLSGPAWAGKADEARQVLSWAETETVVNGLTLVGGVHLDDGVLDQVLDRLIG